MIRVWCWCGVWGVVFGWVMVGVEGVGGGVWGWGWGLGLGPTPTPTPTPNIK